LANRLALYENPTGYLAVPVGNSGFEVRATGHVFRVAGVVKLPPTKVSMSVSAILRPFPRSAGYSKTALPSVGKVKPILAMTWRDAIKIAKIFNIPKNIHGSRRTAFSLQGLI